MKKQKLYTVTAYRWAKRDKHSYVIGVFDNKTKAIKCADEHTNYRGGKYSCFVESCYINEFNNDKNEYTEDVYKSKGIEL